MFFDPNYLVPIVAVTGNEIQFAYPYCSNIVVRHTYRDDETTEQGICRVASYCTHVQKHEISVPLPPYSLLEIRNRIVAKNSKVFTIGCAMVREISPNDWHTCPLSSFLESIIRKYVLQIDSSQRQPLPLKIREAIHQHAASVVRQLTNAPA